jgi:hypothetical protein
MYVETKRFGLLMYKDLKYAKMQLVETVGGGFESRIGRVNKESLVVK